MKISALTGPVAGGLARRIGQGLAVAGLLFSASANATLFDFGVDNDNSGLAFGDVVESFTLTKDGIQLTVSSVTTINDGSGNISRIRPVASPGGVWVGSDDLGVTAAGGHADEIDGENNADEGLWFVFDRVVSLDWFNLDRFSGSVSDDFNLNVGPSALFADIGSNEVHPGIVWNQDDEPAFSPGIISSEFLLWVDGSNDEFRIDRLSVTDQNTPRAAASPFAPVIPEPGLMGALGLGMFCLGLASGVRRRKG